MEEIISYVMETPENTNGNVLREKIKKILSNYTYKVNQEYSPEVTEYDFELILTLDEGLEPKNLEETIELDNFNGLMNKTVQEILDLFGVTEPSTQPISDNNKIAKIIIQRFDGFKIAELFVKITYYVYCAGYILQFTTAFPNILINADGISTSYISMHGGSGNNQGLEGYYRCNSISQTEWSKIPK